MKLRYILPLILASGTACSTGFMPSAGSYRPVTPAEQTGNTVFPPSKTSQQLAPPPMQHNPWNTPRYYGQQPRYYAPAPRPEVISNRPYARNINANTSPFIQHGRSAASDSRFRPPELKGTP